jgi:hypothetical protein
MALARVKNMPGDAATRKVLDAHGLVCVSTAWEDNARSKNSIWGPCVTDMTLRVYGERLPIVRPPNYSDLTWDVKIEDVPLLVGNEHGEPLRTVTLKEYLANFRNYLHAPGTWLNTTTPSLLALERDTHVLMSAQACFLPVPADHGDKIPFHVALYNYQSRKTDPAVLVIVASSLGTSARVLDSNAAMEFAFNQNGDACPLTGQRLTASRAERGKPLEGPMDAEEKAQNMLLIIQVPLKQVPQAPRGAVSKGAHATDWWGGGGDDDSDDGLESYVVSQCAVVPQSYQDDAGWEMVLESATNVALPDNSMQINELAGYESEGMDFDLFGGNSSDRVPDAEHVILAVGAREGPFVELGSPTPLHIARDARWPVRVTLQYYRATHNGVVDAGIAAELAQQFRDARGYATSIGSLVVAGATGRPTEAAPPAWWQDFWYVHGPRYPHFTTGDAAAAYVFKGGRFATGGMMACEHDVLTVLALAATGAQAPAPVWSVLKKTQ